MEAAGASVAANGNSGGERILEISELIAGKNDRFDAETTAPHSQVISELTGARWVLNLKLDCSL